MVFARILGAASVALCVAAGASAAFATNVNVNAASSAGTTISLAAGTYDVTEIQSLYTSANLWDDGGVGSDGVNSKGQLIPCATSSTCVYGFRPTFDISIAGGPETTYGIPVATGAYPATYATAADALAAFETYQAANPITFTLASASNVNFVVPDILSEYCDNTGGVSLSVVSAAPEPSVWMLTIAAIGGVGFMLRRSKQTLGAASRGEIAA